MSKPIPKTFILKVASGCNLSCKYCYMYYRGDASILEKNDFMSMETLRNFLFRLNKYLDKYQPAKPSVAIHGGEPLLLGKAAMREVLRLMRDTLGRSVGIKIQTNGVLIDDEWVNLFANYDVVVGLSIDGPRNINDRWRLNNGGRSTFQKVLRAHKLLSHSAKMCDVSYGGIISVLDPRQDVSEFYNFFARELNVSNWHILLPDVNHDNIDIYNPFGNDEISSFLIRLHDIWKYDPNRPSLKLFESVISLLAGGGSLSELLGVSGSQAVIVDVDGEYQCHDVLRMNEPTSSSFYVSTHDIDEYIESDRFLLVSNKSWVPPDNLNCSRCPIWNVCRGGFVGYRYSQENGYNNESVYCDVIRDLVSHVYFSSISSSSALVPDSSGNRAHLL